jgi:acetate kinase
MNQCISVVNAGSSSIKFSLYDGLDSEELRLVFTGQIDGIGTAPRFKAKNSQGEIIEERSWEDSPQIDHEYLLTDLVGWIRNRRLAMNLELVAVGHRVVHGGELFNRPQVADEEVLTILERFIPLAPLHQPHNLRCIRHVAKLNPQTPQVACFDTAFHTTNPVEAQMFALPRWLYEEGVRRYGFHGLSYEYVARKLPEYFPAAVHGRVVVAHLGSGASMCGIKDGKSVASTMGFSAMDGLPMGTRPGNIDPGVVLYLLQEKGMNASEIERILYKQSGLLGVSGISNDMRALHESSDPRAEEAISLFVYRIQRELGSLVAALGGLDALVFTAGIGENDADLRARVCERSAWAGIRLDPEANRRRGPKISTPDSAVSVWVIPTNEELMIASHTRDAVAGRMQPSPLSANAYCSSAAARG